MRREKRKGKRQEERERRITRVNGATPTPLVSEFHKGTKN
jgi:hypothetical protein